ncbi:MAG: lipid A deacylase LpxR family protein [Burkholderiaceae bacterium]
MLPALLLALAVAWPGSAQTRPASDRADDRPVLRSVIDNDEFVGLNKNDRWYSSGVVIMHDQADQGMPDGLAARLPCAPDAAPELQARRGWAFGQVIGMQNRRDLATVAGNDRPIGALLWLSHLRARFSPRADAGWALSLGTTGPAALGEPVQNGLHRMLGVQEVTTWDHQLRPRTGVELRVHCQHRRPLTDGQGLVLGGGWELVLGNRFSQLEAQVSLALGPAAAQMRPVREARLAWPTPPLTRGWAVIAGMRLRLVARDGLLDGATYRYDNAIEARPLVGEVFIGAQWRASRLWQIGYGAVHRTMDFNGPGVREARYEPQTFGQLTVSLSF